MSPESHSLAPVLPPTSTDPLVRKQAVQDLMAQMQGTYNFMQVSSLSVSRGLAGTRFAPDAFYIFFPSLLGRTPCWSLTDSLWILPSYPHSL